MCPHVQKKLAGKSKSMDTAHHRGPVCLSVPQGWQEDPEKSANGKDIYGDESIFYQVST